jgi:hypothetical protein
MVTLCQCRVCQSRPMRRTWSCHPLTAECGVCHQLYHNVPFSPGKYPGVAGGMFIDVDPYAPSATLYINGKRSYLSTYYGKNFMIKNQLLDWAQPNGIVCDYCVSDLLQSGQITHLDWDNYVDQYPRFCDKCQTCYEQSGVDWRIHNVWDDDDILLDTYVVIYKDVSTSPATYTHYDWVSSERPQWLKDKYLLCNTCGLDLVHRQNIRWKEANKVAVFFRQWYWVMLRKRALRKRDLHLELKYSPDLPFYQEDEYVKHFKDAQHGN